MISSYIALGSNLEHPELQLQRAVQAVASLPDSNLTKVSSAYRSAAVGPGEQPDYLNAVLQLDTQLQAQTLLTALQAIENAQGRRREVRWGARTLDLDILLYGDQQIALPQLTVPHPRLSERNFVLYPLCEIASENLMLPDGRELGTLVAACPVGDLTRTEVTLSPTDGSDNTSTTVDG